VAITVKGVRFAVPQNYFPLPPPPCDTEQSAFPIRALFPDFSGSTPETFEEFHHVGGGWGRVVSILVQSARPSPELEFFVSRWDDRWHIQWSDRPLHGLETGSYKSPGWNWDVFVERGGGIITHVMQCTSPESVPYPGCEGILFFKGVQVHFHFDRQLLPEWRTIHDGVVTLLERFDQSHR